LRSSAAIFKQSFAILTWWGVFHNRPDDPISCLAGSPRTLKRQPSICTLLKTQMRRRTLQRSLVSCTSCLAGNKSSRYLQLTEHYELCDHFFYWLRTFVKNSLRSLSCQEPRILEFRATKEQTQKLAKELSGAWPSRQYLLSSAWSLRSA
jgi:hypothetical protein